jgi:hypothetical protein
VADEKQTYCEQMCAGKEIVPNSLFGVLDICARDMRARVCVNWAAHFNPLSFVRVRQPGFGLGSHHQYLSVDFRFSTIGATGKQLKASIATKLA